MGRRAFHKHDSWEAVGPLLFALSLPELVFCRIDFACRLLAKNHPAELVSLIIAGDELFLGVCPVKINTSRRQAEVSNKIHS